MPETKRRLKVFLCHAHDDKAKTRELYLYLRKRGVQPWLDAENLVGGQNWREEIPKAIKSSDAIIICLSKNSINKEGFVQAEITFALEKALEIPPGRIFIIPARFEDCEVPGTLERFHYVDLFEENGFPRLMKSLKTRAGQLERATVQVPQTDESGPNLTSTLEELEEEFETTEKIAHEKAEREEAEKATQEKLQREAVERAKRESAERKAAREKAKREFAEKSKREKAEHRAVRKAKLEKSIYKSFTTLKSTLTNAVPFFRIAGIVGIIIILFWGGSLAMPQLFSLIPTATPDPTRTKAPTATLPATAVTATGNTNTITSPSPDSSHMRFTSSPTNTRTPRPTPTLSFTPTRLGPIKVRVKRDVNLYETHTCDRYQNTTVFLVLNENAIAWILPTDPIDCSDNIYSSVDLFVLVKTYVGNKEHQGWVLETALEPINP